MRPPDPTVTSAFTRASAMVALTVTLLAVGIEVPSPMYAWIVLESFPLDFRTRDVENAAAAALGEGSDDWLPLRRG